MAKKTKKATHHTPLGIIIALIIFGVLLGMLLLLAIQNAKPGEALYTLKRAVENLHQRSAGTAEAKTVAALRQANERVREIQYLYSTIPAGSGNIPQAPETTLIISQSNQQPTLASASGTTPNPNTSPQPTSTLITTSGPLLDLEPLVGVTSEVGENLGILSTPTQWLSEPEGVLDSILTTGNSLVRGIVGRDIYASPRSQEEVIAQTQGLLEEYNTNIEEVITGYQEILATSTSPKEIETAKEYAYLIGERLLTHRGILERLSLEETSPQVKTVVEESLITIDKNNKLVFQVLPIQQRDELIKKVELLNPNTGVYVQKVIENTQIIKDVEVKDITVIDGDQNIIPSVDTGAITLPPLLSGNEIKPEIKIIDLNSGAVGVNLESVTGVDIEKVINVPSKNIQVQDNQLLNTTVHQAVETIEALPIIGKLDLKIIK